MNLVKWQWWAISSIVFSVIGMGGCIPASSEVSEGAAEVQPVPESPIASNPNEPLLDGAAGAADMNRQLLAQGQILPVTAEVELGGQTIGLEVAQTSQQQAIGLMAREALADDRGMLFPFEPARPVSFWMKNVLISLDMVFVYDGEIVAIAADVPPCEADPCPTYGPDRQIVDYVIELRGGLAKDLGLQPGDPVNIEWLESSTAADTE